MDAITIDRQFCGPPGSGHGGYSAGAFAAALGDQQVAVMLRLPPPLGVELEVHRTADGAELRHDDAVVAVATPTTVDLDEPRTVDFVTAERAEQRFMWADDHPFATCYGCGPARDDGWRTFGGVVDGTDVTASRAVPPKSAMSSDGLLSTTEVWASLDCITATALDPAGAALVPPWVLGRFAVDQREPVELDRPLVVTAWPLGLDGRKLSAAGCLSSEGKVLAVAQATWIQLKA